MGKKIKIAKRHVDLPKPYYVHAMAEIQRQTDRGAAIAGTAYLDLILRGAIEGGLRQDETILGVLFENRGALQEFSARIQLSYAMKIIGKWAYDDLCTLRDIRNAFAHSAEAIDFQSPEVFELCKRLIYPQKVMYRMEPKPTEPRAMFVRDVEMLSHGLYEFIHRGRPTQAFIHMGPERVTAPPTSPKTPKIRVSLGPKVPNQKS